MSDFSHTDNDGDRITLDTYGNTVVLMAQQRRSGPAVLVELHADAARELAAKLSEWAGDAPAPTPEPKPTYAVGDRVEIFGRAERYGAHDGWDGPGRVVAPCTDADGWVFVMPDAGPRAGLSGVFKPSSVRPYTPDYAAMAAEYSPGDLALVGDAPGFDAEPDSCNSGGSVRPLLAGRVVNVVRRGGPMQSGENGRVLVSGMTADGRTVQRLVHVAHLTRAKAVPA